jgi:hypothetical protein
MKNRDAKPSLFGLAPSFLLRPQLRGVYGWEHMSEVSSSSSITTSGRIVRAALIIFPFGTVVLGVASFGFWWWKREQVDERSYAYSVALRRQMTPQALERYVSILGEVLNQPDGERQAAVASFLESSMSPENMGYNPKRDRFINLRLMLVPYGIKARQAAEVQALAGLMALAHELTGERGEATLRFVAVPWEVRDQSGRTALTRLADSVREKSEKVMRITVLGGVGDTVLEEIRQAFGAAQTGVIVESLPETQDVSTTLGAMQALRQKL